MSAAETPATQVNLSEMERMAVSGFIQRQNTRRPLSANQQIEPASAHSGKPVQES
jgi:hypothetical protein